MYVCGAPSLPPELGRGSPMHSEGSLVALRACGAVPTARSPSEFAGQGQRMTDDKCVRNNTHFDLLSGKCVQAERLHTIFADTVQWGSKVKSDQCSSHMGSKIISCNSNMMKHFWIHGIKLIASAASLTQTLKTAQNRLTQRKTNTK